MTPSIYIRDQDAGPRPQQQKPGRGLREGCLIRAARTSIHEPVIFAKPCFLNTCAQHTPSRGRSLKPSSIRLLEGMLATAAPPDEEETLTLQAQRWWRRDSGWPRGGRGEDTEAHSPTTQISLNSLSGMINLVTCACSGYFKNYTFHLFDLRVKNAGFQLKNVGGGTLLFKIILVGYIQNALERRKAASITC